MIKRLLLLISLFNFLFFYEINKEIEKEERELVRILLEDDKRIFRKLIPAIDSLDYAEFSKVFNGDYNYEGYNSDYRSSLKLLALKFYNFQFILSDWSDKRDYYKYLKKLWVKYPNIEKLSKLNENDISEKLKSILTDYIDWPENIKKELIELIQKPIVIASEIKKKIEEDNFEVHQIIEKLNEMKNAKIQSYEQFIKENQNSYKLLLNEIQKLFNKTRNPNEDPNQFFLNLEESKSNEFLKNNPSYESSYKLILLNVIQQTIKRSTTFDKVFNSTSEAIEKMVVDLYNLTTKKEINVNNNLQDIKECFEKGKAKWSPILKNGINILLEFFQTYTIADDTYHSIQTLNNLIKSEDGFKARLKKISKDFEEINKFPRNLSNDQEKNLKLIKESYNYIEKVQKDIIKLIEDIETEIKKRNDRKNNLFLNIAFRGFNVLLSIYDFYKTKDPIMKAFDLINFVCSGTDMALHAVDIVNLYKIIGIYDKTLKDAFELQKKIKKEIDLLFEESNNINNIFPQDYDL